MEFKKFTLTPRVINDLKKRSIVGLLFYIIIAIIIVTTDDYNVRHPDFSKLFLISIFSICMFRLCHLLVSRWCPPKYEKTNQYIFLTSVALTGLIWGLNFALIMGHPDETQVKILTIMCCIGICSGAVVAFIPEFKLALVYSFLILTPIVAVLIKNQDNNSLALCTILFFIYLGFMTKKGNDEYWGALENEHNLKEQSKMLEMVSRVDSLTGLSNRRHFNQAFSFEWNRALRNKTALIVMICDIDHFKNINDDFGHLAGDQYLKALSSVINSVFKRKTDVIARWGGEEFIILMNEITGEDAFVLADMFRSKIEDFYLDHENQQIKTTISIGISSCIPQARDKKETLISRADKALYQSKSSGRNTITFHS